MGIVDSLKRNNRRNMEMITILNTTILTDVGTYKCELVTPEQAQQLIKDNLIQSAVGHESTAQIISELLGIDVPMNRIQYQQKPGDTALCFKLKGRAPEGKILSREEVEQIGYEWKTIKRVAKKVYTGTECCECGYVHHAKFTFCPSCNYADGWDHYKNVDVD